MEEAIHSSAATKYPDMASYGPGITGTVRRKTIVNVPPIQGSIFGPTGQKIIQIVLPKNGFLNGLNSYLIFNHQSPYNGTFANNLSPAAYSVATDEVRNALSESASSCIQRMRIKIGGRIVEDVDDYNVLHAIIQKTLVSQQFKDSAAGQCEGYEASWVKKMVEYNTPSAAIGTTVLCISKTNGLLADFGAVLHTAAAASPIAPYTRGNVTAIISGIRVNLNRRAVPNVDISTGSIADDVSNQDIYGTLERWAATNKQYQIRLISGFLDSKKYIPLRFLPPVEIELTLADFSRSHKWQPAGVAITPGSMGYAIGDKNANDYYLPAITTSARPGNHTETASADKTYCVSGVYYMAEILEFDETFYTEFQTSLSAGITIPYTTFTNHGFSHTGGNADIQVAERVRSAKSILAVMRRNGDLAHGPYSKFCFMQNGLYQFQVKIGTQYFPMQPIDLYNGGGNANNDPYNGQRLLELNKVLCSISDRTLAHGNLSVDGYDAFVIGVDLDREYNRLSGLDTTKGLPLFLNLKHNTYNSSNNPDGGMPCYLNVFVNYDMFLDLLPGEVITLTN